MQVFEFKPIENNPFTLTTDTLTIVFKGQYPCKNFETLISECLPYDETLTKSILSKFSCSSLELDNIYQCSRNEQFLPEMLFAIYFLIENQYSFPFSISFLNIASDLNREEMDYINKHCPRFGITEEQINKWSDIVERYLAFNQYYLCPIVSTLQRNMPFVARVSAKPSQFSHGKTDLVIKTYSFAKSYSHVINELEFHRNHSHPNILRILDYQINVKKDTITVVMEYKNGAGYIPRQLKEIQLYMLQLLQACVYMRQNLITHHNLKYDNIIYDYTTDSVLKVIDFEHCTFVGGEFYSGNSHFRSPEKIDFEFVGPSSDMYSVGIMFEYFITHSKGITEEADKLGRNLISKMKTSVENRISPLKALEHEFFSIK